MADEATKDVRKRFLKNGSILVGCVVVISAFIVWVLLSLNLSVVAVNGESMEPTLHNGQFVFIQQAKTPEKGMLVVFQKPSSWDYNHIENEPKLIKRIQAVNGDTVSYDGEKLYVNNEEVYDLEKNDYPCHLYSGYSHTLINDEFFVMGDNHKKSFDSLKVLCDGANIDVAYIPSDDVDVYGHQFGGKK